MQIPTIMNGFNQIAAYKKVKSGQWKVIKKTDMEIEPAKEVKTSTPSLSNAR
jgi:hypothetical protein